jgi:hypothetical protein
VRALVPHLALRLSIAWKSPNFAKFLKSALAAEIAIRFGENPAEMDAKAQADY